MDDKNKEVSELQYIKGVGPRKAKALLREGIETPRDLAEYFPRDYIDRNAVSSLKALSIKLLQQTSANLNAGFADYSLKGEITVVGKIVNKALKKLRGNRQMLRLDISDGDGEASILFWSYADFFNKSYKENQWIVVSGSPELDKYKKITFHHPEIQRFDAEEEKRYRKGEILPIYRMPSGLKKARWNMKLLRQTVRQIIDDAAKSFKECLPPDLIKKYDFPSKSETVKSLHFPKSGRDISRSIERMKYEEIFFFELFLAIQKEKVKEREKGPAFDPKSPKARELYESLPFELTKDQKKTIREITNDMQSGGPMNRLLQGDVGSGKTIVALLIMLSVIDNGYQAAIMAPTEILAEQHYHTIKNFLEDIDVEIVQLLGGQKKKMRNKILEKISTGEANIIIGTHAMFQSDIAYNKLGLIIIDEQHRFGVSQRGKLRELGKLSFGEEISPHILVMSATPIPRTLSLTLYGDLDVSIIREKPKDRKPIDTRVVFESQLKQVYEFIRSQAEKGKQAYIVYPLVEESEKLEYKAATKEFEKINEVIFPKLKCGLLHGQMFWYEKEESMKAFLNKEYDILVATTVIEVGIDVPNANVMLIENAEKFGLAQLHQLRGRVGRSADKSFCFLAAKESFKYEFKNKWKKEGEQKNVIIRLRAMEKSDDGFQIAETDLQLRGPGDVLGTRQAGMPEFNFIDLASDGDIISKAKRDAFRIIEDDPHLRKPENKKLREEFVKLRKTKGKFYEIA